MIRQLEITLGAKPRGIHLITSEILQALPPLPEQGLLNLFLRHTSAALTINENYDPSVREDMTMILDHLVPERGLPYRHTAEGPDDMPAHMKSSLLSHSLTIPVRSGKPALGTWQGIYLCEFRNHGGNRRLLVTIYS